MRSAPVGLPLIIVLGLASSCGGMGSAAVPSDASTPALEESGCGNSVDLDAVAPGCPDDLPSDCPGAAPSFQKDVSPIIAHKCAGCHAPGGVEPQRPYTSYDQVFSARRDMLTRIYNCVMPPTCAAPLTPQERHAVLQWFVCMAPNN